jgi:ribosomal RNA-processing protein 17
LEAHVKAVDEALKYVGVVSDEDEEDDEEGEDTTWEGIMDQEVPRVDREEEYIDEERYTTVTVEEVGISRNGFVKANGMPEEERDPGPRPKTAGSKAPDKEIAKIPDKRKPKMPRNKKKRNFRYENKEERNAARMKERSMNKAHARVRRSKK